MGHFVYPGIHTRVPGAKDPRYFTFLRHPVERVVSLYWFLKHASDSHWHREIVDANWSLDEWLDGSRALWARNGQTRHLLIGTHEKACAERELDPRLLSDAMRTLDQFWFVGLTETFDRDSAFLLGRLGATRFAKKNAIRVNKRKEAATPGRLRSHRRSQSARHGALRARSSTAPVILATTRGRLLLVQRSGEAHEDEEWQSAVASRKIAASRGGSVRFFCRNHAGVSLNSLYLFGSPRLSLGAPVPDDPMNSRLPSGRIMSAPLARLAPFFARYPSMVISVPGCSDALVKPRRTSVFGVPPSIIHLVTVPSAFLTSR